MNRMLLFYIFLAYQSISAQTYYDLGHNKIDKSTFQNELLNRKIKAVKNDSLNTFKLIKLDERREIGSLSDTANLFNELNGKLNLNFDPTKPLIIFYYPGMDECTKNSMATRKSKLQWDAELLKKIKKITDVNILRLYKNKESIKTLKDYDWKKDPNVLIENLFFNYHYNCGSFVVLSKEKYASFFSEYSHDEVLINLGYLLKK